MTTPPEIPALCAGDVLTRSEFERRYAAMPHVKKAELIEGVVYMPSPVRYTQHGNPHFLLSAWLGRYVEATPGVAGATDSTVRLDLDNEPQPDLMLRIVEGGTSRIDAEGYVEGAPELAIEVAASSVSYDLHQKLRAYRRNGVQEYLVLRFEDAAVDWFELRDGCYEHLPAQDDGLLASGRFPGLLLDPTALLRGDAAALRAAVERGVATAAHARFCQQLRRRSATAPPPR